MRFARLLPGCLVFLLAFGHAAILPAQPGPDNNAKARVAALRGSFGTYAAPPRKADGHVDCEQLLTELKELGVNTYNWLVWQKTNDWSDLKIFLPLARQAGIQVWVNLVPPSESPPRTRNFSEPFRLDFQRWGEAIARLSVAETNLVAWSIDDFTYNLKFFTPEMMAEIIGAVRAINPRLAFVPCSYFKHVKPDFGAIYGKYVDAVLFPYRAESQGSNLKDATALPAEVRRLHQLLGESMPIILDIYATAHSRLGASTPEYVRDTMKLGREHCDGVMIYCHQSPKSQPEKNRVLKEEFAGWRKTDSWPSK